jgi:hypothetical protein
MSDKPSALKAKAQNRSGDPQGSTDHADPSSNQQDTATAETSRSLQMHHEMRDTTAFISLMQPNNRWALTHCMMVYMDTLSEMLKQRNTASQEMYVNLSTVLRSGTPEVSYSSMRTGWSL